MVGCHPVLVNVPEPGHGVIGTGVIDPPAISNDGTVVAFPTSDFLTAEDHSGTWDVYARDVLRRETRLMSVSPDGGQAGCGVQAPYMSGDGRYVAWGSCSFGPTVPPPPGTVATSTYVKDRETGELEQIGIPEHLDLSGGGFGLLDGDGSHIVFWCNPQPRDEIPISVCVQDRGTLDTTVVSRRTDGEIARAFAVPMSISDDGRLVAFAATFAGVVPGSSDTRQQLFVRDTVAGVTSPVTISPSVLSGDLDGRLSGDGTAAVVWQREPPYHIVHKDLVTGAVHRVNQSRCGDAALSPDYAWASISDNGDVVAFQSGSDNLVPDDTNGDSDVFVWRTKAPCLLQRVSTGPGLREGDGESYWPAVSGDGSSVVFVSAATNLMRDDTNGAPDAFLVRLAAGMP